MNIGSMIRGLLGDSKAGEPKSLELKEGQVVRGVVLSVSDSGKEAVVQIQGTPVRAELESPLQVGQSMNLQVSPPGEGGLPVLKPVSLGESVTTSPQNMGEALEALGLTDAKAGREIVQAMQSGGIALTKETAEQLNAVMNAKPAGVPTDQWLEAAVISVKRGLPVTAESIKGLQQAVFGPQLHQLLADLEEQVNAWMGQMVESEPEAELNQNSLPAKGAPVSTKVEGNPIKDGAVGTGSNSATDDVETTTEANSGKQASLNLDKAIIPSKGSGPAVTPNSETNMAANLMDEATGEPNVSGGGIRPGGSAAPQPGSVIPQGQGSSLAASSLMGTQESVTLSGLVQDPDGAAGIVKNAGQAAGSHASGAKVAGDTSSLNIGRGTNPTGTPTAAVKNTADGATAANAALADAAHVEVPPAATGGRSGPALLAKLQGVLTELRGTQPQLANVPPADAAGQDRPAPAAGTPRGEANPAAASPPLQDAPAPTRDMESWVGRVLKLLGAEHEQQAVRGGAGLAAEARTAAAAPAAEGRGAPLTPAALHAVVGDGDGADTLKGVLLQVLSSSEAPAPLKDAASQVVQHMTGQQLLLNTDRTAPFAQVTLFLPLQGPNGEETASVHIQSRRGRKGELDSANCRLWFDLDMKQLGQTLVDVQVVDHIVSLKLHNNNPEVLELFEDRREDIKTAVESIGYQLSGLKTEPLPVPKEADTNKSYGKLTDFVPDSYKGVDYRI